MLLLSLIKKILKDERGAYGGVEVMLIVGIVVVIAMSIMGAFKGDGATTGLPGSAKSVSDTVQSTITGAAGGGGS